MSFKDLQSNVNYCISKRLEKQAPEELLRHHKIVKLSLFYTGPLEERQINAHIFGLLTTALLIAYYPISFFFPANIGVFLHIFYVLSTLFALYKYSNAMYDLASINRLISTGVCDVMDEKTYAQKRAESFAQLKNDEYKRNLEK